MVLILIFKLLAFLPIWVLYKISDLLAFVLHKVLKYRLNIIQANAMHSFPNFTANDLADFTRRYYVFLADQVVETIKLHRMSKDTIAKKLRYVNPEVMLDLISQVKNIVIMMGHCGNWEWAGASTAITFNTPTYPVYRKIKNKKIDQFYLNLRSRFGGHPVLDKHCIHDLSKLQGQYMVAMLADQSPRRASGFNLDFLNRKTAFYRGSEVMAKRLENCAVIFAHVRRDGRGRYAIYFELPTPDWRESKGKLIREFALFLEKEIRTDPVNWLWSHNRWKHNHD